VAFILSNKNFFHVQLQSGHFTVGNFCGTESRVAHKYVRWMFYVVSHIFLWIIKKLDGTELYLITLNIIRNQINSIFISSYVLTCLSHSKRNDFSELRGYALEEWSRSFDLIGHTKPRVYTRESCNILGIRFSKSSACPDRDVENETSNQTKRV
jgi:hypothetical protein